MGAIGFDKTESVAQIALELGVSSTEQPDVYNAVGPLWDAFADKAPLYPRLQYFYTRREAADMLMGAVRGMVDVTDANTSAKLNQLFANATVIRTKAHEEILTLEARARATRMGTSGTITKTASVMVPAGQIDPADTVYRGDPFKTLKGRGY